MSTVVLPFVPRPGATARANLNGFIAHAKAARFFRGPGGLDWHAGSWDLLPFADARGAHPSGWTIHFTTHEGTRRGPRSPHAPEWQAPFVDAAKALLVHFLTATDMATPGKFVAALRAIERAFRDLGRTPDLVALDPRVLDRACEIVAGSVKGGWEYGRALERIVSEAVNPKRLSRGHLLWRNPFPYQGAIRSDRVNCGGEEVEGAGKLPQLQCIIDLAGVFREARIDADVVTTSWFALAMFAPSRSVEILTLPAACERSSEGTYGLAWRPAKGADVMTKFATSEDWADVARKAIARLTALGASARKAARWYAEHPGQLYLPKELERLRGEPLTLEEIRAALGMPGQVRCGSRLQRALVRCGTTSDGLRTARGGRGALYDFRAVEQYVLSVLPPRFPIVDERSGLLAADALFCLPRHVMRTDGGLQANVPDVISHHQIYNDLGGKPNGTTVFFRHELVDPRTGQNWRLDTHGPRHLLNTLAQSKHLSEALIAFWSGRKRIDQNGWYDHVPAEARIEAYVQLGEHAPEELGVIGPLAEKARERSRREGITYGEALRLELGSIIVTRFGLCRHNYAQTPCPKDKNCIGCGENVFVKGDARQIAEAESQLAISLAAAGRCRAALDAGELAAERWLAKHSEAAARWGVALMLLTDPETPDGTLITLPPPKSSQTKAGLALAIADAEAGSSEAA